MEQHEQPYVKTELTMGAGRANLLALFFMVPIIVSYGIVYVLLWPEQFNVQNLKSVVQTNRTLIMYMPAIMLVVFVVGAVVHELIHGITWAAFCRYGLSSIRYGVHWQALTPYCHCKEVLPLQAYMLGGAMPGLLMGILPAVAGLVTGSFLVFVFGVFFTMAAAGDMLILWMLRKQRRNVLIQDHPALIGCYVLHRP